LPSKSLNTAEDRGRRQDDKHQDIVSLHSASICVSEAFGFNSSGTITIWVPSGKDRGFTFR
jgi:hypothetical protein